MMAAIHPELAERGRLMAAHEIANNPEARKRVEDEFGVEMTRANYPEAYRNAGIFTGFAKKLDDFRSKIPW